jgi:hypothetical protein
MLPKDIRDDLKYAREMKDRERGILMGRITANASSDQARASLAKVYGKMSLEELRIIAAAVPQVTDNRGQGDAPPLYLWAGTPAANSQDGSGPRELEGGPNKMDLTENASPGLLRYLGKKTG